MPDRSQIRDRWRSACCGSRPFGSAASATVTLMSYGLRLWIAPK